MKKQAKVNEWLAWSEGNSSPEGRNTVTNWAGTENDKYLTLYRSGLSFTELGGTLQVQLNIRCGDCRTLRVDPHSL
jgi:hypothetical protein